MNVSKISITKFSSKERFQVEDSVTVEEPLEIYIDNKPFYTTMRMPGDEISLASGICFTNGMINSMEDVADISYPENTWNRINIYLKPSINKEKLLLNKEQGRTIAYSSSGICGNDMIKNMLNCIGSRNQQIKISSADISGMQRVMQGKQIVFPVTGGTHGAGIFGSDCEILSFSEDVGRHNALDKAIGKLLLSGNEGKAAVVVLTSRLSFEMVQKVARLKAEIVCGVSSPTTLAIDLAEKVNLTLLGFMRNDRGNIYTCPERIV